MAYSSINQKSLDRCKQFVFGEDRRGVWESSSAITLEKMLRGRLEMGAEYMHIKKAGARGTRQIRKGSVFISKHISSLIEWPPNYYHQTKMQE